MLFRSCTPAAGNTTCWSGSFLNWLVTRRIDATRMVLIGGKLESRTSFNYNGYGNYKILGNNERSDRTIKKKYAGSDSYSPVPDDEVAIIMSPADNGSVLSEYDPYAKIALAGGGGQSGYINDSSGTVIGEFGKVSTNHNWTTVTLLRTFTNPVVVAKPLSFNGSDPAAIRIKNVTTNSFKIKTQEWKYLDDSHSTEDIFYMVVENGHHSLDNGLEIEAGTNTTSYVYAVGCNIDETQSTPALFQSSFSSTPLVIHSVSTYNGGDTVNSRVWGVSTSGFTFAMQEEENQGGHTTETVSYIAITPGSIDNAVFTLEAGNLLNFEENWKTINFTSSFSTAPAFLAAMQTKNDDNTAVLRYQSLGTSSAGVKVEEEASCDTETNHGLEDIGYIALTGKGGLFNIALVVNDEPTGLLHDISGDVRLGISFYPFDPNVNDIYNGSKIDGGTLKFNIPLNPFVKKPSTNGGYRQLVGYIGTSLDDIVDAIEHYPLVWGTTPIAENLWEVIQYFEQDTPYYDSGNFDVADAANPERDPYYFTEYADIMGCCQSNIIVFTDGYPYKDANIPPGIVDYDVDVNTDDCSDSVNPDTQCQDNLDDVAYWSYWNTTNDDHRDLRDSTTKNLDGNQYLRIYTVGFADGTIRQILQDTADNAGGEAYAAEDGVALKSALLQAFSSILGKASSGTAASVVSNSGAGDAAVFQSYFKSSVKENLEDRKWLGYIHALFIDKNGNLREDNGNDGGVLDSGDNIIKMSYSSSNGTEIYKCAYTSETLNEFTCSTDAEDDGLDSINPLWDGGKSLWQTPPASRRIFTTVNGYSTIDFEAGTSPDPDNSSTLQPYLRAADNPESKNIINWIRGDDLTDITDSNHPDGYRKRDLTINGVNNVWKLGDIIYSTPTVVGRPMENYDLLYGDSSYTAFRSKYLKRRQVVYTGANDGMLHAFNAGFFDVAGLEYCPDLDTDDNCTSAGSHSLGQELWSFIPRGLLPHLKWLTDPDYTHVYYVDLKPKIADVKIFTDTTTDTTHINGWGTILIGGFRYGGKDISWTSASVDYSASPEYFALDITDPLNPQLLWTFTNPGLGLSMTYPSIVKIEDDWFAIFGSGAVDYDTDSNLTSFQSGNIFVLKISGGIDGEISAWTENTNFWKISTYEIALKNALTFMADPITVDVDIDYDVDVIYFGENYQDASSNWNALLRRITTSKGTQSSPADWTISTVANINTIAGANDVAKRITSSPSAAMDGRANLWVFFGTGQFLGLSDKNQTDTGAFYAVKDECWAGGTCITSYTDLMDMSLATVNVNGSVSGITPCSGSAVSTWPDLLSASYNCDGWAMYFGAVTESEDFTGETLTHSGERVFTKPLVLGGLVTWATYIPESDECSYEGDSNIYAVYYKTGSAYRDYVFQEQKDAATSTDNIARVRKLGKGMPSSISAQIKSSGTIKGFAQQSTGSILEIESISPVKIGRAHV